MTREEAEIVLTARDQASGQLRMVGASILGVAASISRLAEDAAKTEMVRRSFENMARSANLSSQEILQSMRDASGGMIADAALMRTANEAFLLIGGDIATKFPKLMEIAQASSRATGQSVDFMLSSLIRGIGRASPLKLDDLGLTISLSETYGKYAATVGKSAEELTKAEQQQALLNAVTEQGNEFIARMGGSVQNTGTMMARSRAQMENMKDSMGALISRFVGFAPAAMPVVAVLSDTWGMAMRLKEPLIVVIGLITGLEKAEKGMAVATTAANAAMATQGTTGLIAMAAAAAPVALALLKIAAVMALVASSIKLFTTIRARRELEDFAKDALVVETSSETIQKALGWITEAAKETATAQEQVAKAVATGLAVQVAAIEKEIRAIEASEMADDKKEATVEALRETIERLVAQQMRATDQEWAYMRGVQASIDVEENWMAAGDDRNKILKEQAEVLKKVKEAEDEETMALQMSVSEIQKAIDAEEDWTISSVQALEWREQAARRAAEVEMEALDRLRDAWKDSARDYLRVLGDTESEQKRHEKEMADIRKSGLVAAPDYANIEGRIGKQRLALDKRYGEQMVRLEAELWQSRNDAAWRATKQRQIDAEGAYKEDLAELDGKLAEELGKEKASYIERAGAAATAAEERRKAEETRHAEELKKTEERNRALTVKMALAQAERDGMLAELGFPKWIGSAEEAYAAIESGLVRVTPMLTQILKPAMDEATMAMWRAEDAAKANKEVLSKDLPAESWPKKLDELLGADFDALNKLLPVAETKMPDAFKKAGKGAKEELKDLADKAPKLAEDTYKAYSRWFEKWGETMWAPAVVQAQKELDKLRQPIYIPLVWSYPAAPTPAGPPPGGESYQGGGVVPGPEGKPRVAVVHGGETIVPSGGTLVLTVVGDEALERKLSAFFANRGRETYRLQLATARG